MSWLQQLLDNTLFQAFLAIIAIVGFAYAFIVQRINKEKKEISFCLKSNHLIRGKRAKFEKLSITYDGQQIEDLCVSKFTVWNSGNRTLNRTDMVESKELTISVANECRVLDVELIACSDETNGFSVRIENEHTVKVLFEYADKKEGAVIQIIHTGNDEDIQIDCKIKGGNPIKNIVNDPALKIIRKVLRKKFFVKVSIIFIGIMIVLFFCMSILFVISIFNPELQVFLMSPTMSPIENSFEVQKSAIVTSVIFFSYSIIMGALYIPLIKNHFNMGIPKTLRSIPSYDLNK